VVVIVVLTAVDVVDAATIKEIIPREQTLSGEIRIMMLLRATQKVPFNKKGLQESIIRPEKTLKVKMLSLISLEIIISTTLEEIN